jgi:hypothetical protein
VTFLFNTSVRSWRKSDSGIPDSIVISSLVMSVFLQNGSNSSCQCVLCKCSQPASVFLVFDTVQTFMDSLGSRWNLAAI